MKLWAGRSSGDVDARLSAINNSIGFDSRMYRQDITGSIAHATMLGKVGVITEDEKNQIVEGLKGILADIDSGALEIDMTCEDIHTFVEATLTERIGVAGKKLHTARSRNDQVALDIRMYLADQIDRLIELARDLTRTLAWGLIRNPARDLARNLARNLAGDLVRALIRNGTPAVHGAVDAGPAGFVNPRA